MFERLTFQEFHDDEVERLRIAFNRAEIDIVNRANVRMIQG